MRIQTKSEGTKAVVFVIVSALMLFRPPRGLSADPDESEVRALKEEIQRLKAENEANRRKMEEFEHKLEQIETKSEQKQKELEQLQTKTEEKQKELSAEITKGPPQSVFDRYLGSHTFTITGAAGGQFIYDQQSAPIDDIHNASQNSFFIDWEPMILYRPTDWILFQGVFSAGFGSNGTGTDLSTADFHLFLNKYMTVVGGLFDQPFGDWYETQSPMWVNRFVTAPLPFGVEPVVPPGEIGVQLRGGVQFGQLGQNFDYTVWGGNGPEFSSDVLGAAVSGPNAVASSQTNGKSIGARFRVYPLPIDCEWGRLEFGASTYNGKWLDGNWFNSWGADFNYFIGDLQTRGEWVQAYRQMPNGQPSDNRQGWYVQGGYFLTGLKVPGIPDVLNDYLRRLEPLVRYSGVNQRAVSTDDIQASTGVGMGGTQIGLVPDFGISGSPALWAPHSRELALGLDYWIAPSIVWQNEFDLEMPHNGGLFVASDGTATPAGTTPADRVFLSQFTIGF
jgi:hypothetical protein